MFTVAPIFYQSTYQANLLEFLHEQYHHLINLRCFSSFVLLCVFHTFFQFIDYIVTTLNSANRYHICCAIC